MVVARLREHGPGRVEPQKRHVIPAPGVGTVPDHVCVLSARQRVDDGQGDGVQPFGCGPVEVVLRDVDRDDSRYDGGFGKSGCWLMMPPRSAESA